jgi:hypothetical protein
MTSLNYYFNPTHNDDALAEALVSEATRILPENLTPSNFPGLIVHVRGAGVRLGNLSYLPNEIADQLIEKACKRIDQINAGRFCAPTQGAYFRVYRAGIRR